MTLEVGIAKRTLDARPTVLHQKRSKPLDPVASARCNPDRAVARSAPGFLVFVANRIPTVAPILPVQAP